MKQIYLRRSFLLFIFILCATQGYSQLAGWLYRMPVTAYDSSGVNQTNHQIKLRINTAALIASGHMQSAGEDIRFADSCGTTIYQHYVDSGMNSVNTIIWVRVPVIPANGSSLFYMFYGNASAANTSSFAGTFPSAFISGGPNVTFTGVQTYDWFQVDVNDTVFVQAGASLTINAVNTIINGVISGNGMGNPAPALNTSGIGAGAGTTSAGANSGSGGGSYGGVGGTGGMDAGDTPGTGGPSYGTALGTDIAMGSSGGSGTTFGGSGGGCFILNSDYVNIPAGASITMNGSTAPATASRGGGGGSGGGILIMTRDFTFDGLLSCNGGVGSTGTSTFNDGGGGGGGGRVKVFYTGNEYGTMGVYDALGAAGGPYGDQAYGTPGQAGSTSLITGGGYDAPYATYGTEVVLTAPSLSLSATTICLNDVVNATATAGYTSYTWLVNGNPVSTGPSNTYSYSGLTGGEGLSVSTSVPCYPLVSSTYTVIVNSNPTVSMGPDTTMCGDTLILDAGNVGSTYLWNDLSTTQMYVVTNSGIYTVVVTDANGCTGTDAVTVNYNFPPTVSINPINNTCLDDFMMSLGGSPAGGTFSGPGVSGLNFDPMAAGAGTHVIMYSYTDANGCTGFDTTTAYVDLCLNITSIDPNGFGIIPNPNNGSFVIEFNASADEAIIEVLDLTGKVVQSSQVNSVAKGTRTTVNCNEQANGVYFVRVTANGESTVKKMMIVK